MDCQQINIRDGETESVGPGSCECEELAAAHTWYSSVDGQTVAICPGPFGERVDSAVARIIRIIAETSRRVGGLRRDGTFPPSLGEDIAVELANVFAKSYELYVECEYDGIKDACECQRCGKANCGTDSVYCADCTAGS